MRRWCLGLLVLPALVGLFACSGAQPEASNAGADVCPVLNAGPPPVCPEGCTWDGEQCRKHSGIIIIDARDAGPSSDPPKGP